MLKAMSMISTDSLQPRRTIADQLDELVLESYGAVDILFPEYGTSSMTALATEAWGHAFVRHTPATALLDFSACCLGEIYLRDIDGHRSAQCSLTRAGDLLINISADILVINGASTAAELNLPAFLEFLVRARRVCGLVLAPVSDAAGLIHQVPLKRLRTAADPLISPDVVGDQRAALIAATLVRNSREGSDS